MVEKSFFLFQYHSATGLYYDWSNPVVYSNPQYTTDLELLRESGSVIKADINGAGTLQDPEILEQYIDWVLTPLFDAGVKVWVDLEVGFGNPQSVTDIGYDTWNPVPLTSPREIPPWSSPSPWGGSSLGHGVAPYYTARTPDQFHTDTGYWPALWWDTPSSEYELRFGDAIDMLSTLPIEGFAWEAGYTTGIDWLGHATSKPLMQYLAFPGNNLPTNSYYLFPDYHSVAEGVAGRIGQVDKVMVEVYYLSQAAGARTLISMIYDTDPTKWVGLTSAVLPVEYLGIIWDGTTATPTPLEQQQAEIINLAWYAHEHVKPFDALELQWSPDDPTSSGFIEALSMPWMLKFMNAELPIQNLQYDGLIPVYKGASTCTHEATPSPETFENTGNEIILLKDVGTASTHDITVTSSLDPLTYEDYTLSLNPERGTIIGPYPPDDYGALPTITYDNTNLYVSILKVEPTA